MNGDGTFGAFQHVCMSIADIGSQAMAKASEVLGPNAEVRVKEVKSWLKFKGVRDFEPVSLFCDQLAKVCYTWFYLPWCSRRNNN